MHHHGAFGLDFFGESMSLISLATLPDFTFFEVIEHLDPEEESRMHELEMKVEEGHLENFRFHS